MGNSNERLNTYVNKNSKYFVLLDGEERIVKFISADFIPNRFDGGRTDCVRYVFDVDGIQQSWDRGSRSLAEQLSRIPEGSKIGITKSGFGNQTKYFVRLIDDADDKEQHI